MLEPGACAALQADEDREEIQAETHKQEETFDQIGEALSDLKRMGNVSCPPCPLTLTSKR